MVYSSNWNPDIIPFSFVCMICIAWVCSVVNLLWVLPDTNKDGDDGTNYLCYTLLQVLCYCVKFNNVVKTFIH